MCVVSFGSSDSFDFTRFILLGFFLSVHNLLFLFYLKVIKDLKETKMHSTIKEGYNFSINEQFQV